LRRAVFVLCIALLQDLIGFVIEAQIRSIAKRTAKAELRAQIEKEDRTRPEIVLKSRPADHARAVAKTGGRFVLEVSSSREGGGRICKLA
jgi:hypothetical protein